jgi:NADH dehydrogenase FAD-containing subunit
MTEAIRAANPLIENYIEGKAVDIDLEKQILSVQLSSLLEDTRSGEPPLSEIHYDKLVVAVGCKVLDTFVPGADKHCYKLKSCDDARKLRTAIGECLEFGSRPCVAPPSEKDPMITEEEIMQRAEIRRKRLTWVIVGAGPTGTKRSKQENPKRVKSTRLTLLVLSSNN